LLSRPTAGDQNVHVNSKHDAVFALGRGQLLQLGWFPQACEFWVGAPLRKLAPHILAGASGSRSSALFHPSSACQTQRERRTGGQSHFAPRTGAKSGRSPTRLPKFQTALHPRRDVRQLALTAAAHFAGGPAVGSVVSGQWKRGNSAIVKRAAGELRRRTHDLARGRARRLAPCRIMLLESK
jgi:hypothetical protein